ncbi:MAG: hypothetical protein ACJ78Q_12515 [Chloroflexia bacterium]
MPGAGPHTSVTLPARHGAGWSGLGWKLPLALLFAILLLVSVSVPLPGGLLLLALVRSSILIWGGLVVCIAASNLMEGTIRIRVAWTALAVGAYAALAIPGVVAEPAQMVGALGPVAALTLAAHLGRRDLPRALRDWALVMGLGVYAALGFVAVSQVLTATGFGLSFFLLVALLPPLVAEALLLLLRRVDPGRQPIWSQLLAVGLATALAVTIFAVAGLNRSTPLAVWVIFGLVAGLLLGGALLISVLTMPLIEAALPRSEDGIAPGRWGFVRAFMELSHASVLISLMVYLLLRLLAGAYLV